MCVYYRNTITKDNSVTFWRVASREIAGAECIVENICSPDKLVTLVRVQAAIRSRSNSLILHLD